MAAKAWGQHQKAVDEVFFQNEAVSLCLLINRRARIMRVVDFRAGPTAAKRLFVVALAQREGVEKVYTLVERDEVATWVKLGFAKEGNIPGFYKRSDAFLLGCTVPPARSSAPTRGRDGTLAATPVRTEARGETPDGDGPLHSETRLAVAERVAAVAPPMTEAQERMERTILTAKKGLKDPNPKSTSLAKVVLVSEAEARKAVAASLRGGRALTAFQPFGRDVARRYFLPPPPPPFHLYPPPQPHAPFPH